MPDTPIVPHARLGFASVCSLLGFLIATVVHASTFTSFSMSPSNPLFWIMHIGIFPLFIPMALALQKWNEPRSGPFGLKTYRLRWRELNAYLPPWGVRVQTVLFAYAILNFFLAVTHLPGRGIGSTGSKAMDPEQARYLVRAFSGHWLFIYAALALYYLYVPRNAMPADAGQRASV